MLSGMPLSRPPASTPGPNGRPSRPPNLQPTGRRPAPAPNAGIAGANVPMSPAGPFKVPLPSPSTLNGPEPAPAPQQPPASAPVRQRHDSTSSSSSAAESSGTESESSSSEDPDDGVYTYKDVTRALNKVGRKIAGAGAGGNVSDGSTGSGSSGGKKRKGKKERKREKERAKNAGKKGNTGPSTAAINIKGASAANGSAEIASSPEDGWHDEPEHPEISVVPEEEGDDVFEDDDEDDDEGEDEDDDSFVDADLQIDGSSPSHHGNDFSSATVPALMSSSRGRRKASKGGLLGRLIGGSDEGDATPRAAQARTPNGSRPSSPLPSPPATLISDPSPSAPVTSTTNVSSSPEYRFHNSKEFQERYKEMHRRYSGGKITTLAQREEGRREWRKDHREDGSEGGSEASAEGGEEEREDVGEVLHGERWSSGTHTPTSRSSTSGTGGVQPIKGSHRSALEREVERRRKEHDRAVWGYARNEEEDRAWAREEWRNATAHQPAAAA